jgi:site-specific recombinase XerD
MKRWANTSVVTDRKPKRKRDWALEELEEKEEHIEWLREMRPENTTKSYACYRKQFVKWCQERGRISFPASDITLSLWLRYLHEVKKLAASTICNNASSAVSDMYKFSTFESPSLSGMAKETRRAVKRHAPPPKKRKPLTKKILAAIHAKFWQHGWVFETVRNMCLLVLMFAGMLRESEAVAFNSDDLYLDEIEGVEVLCMVIERSKTDQERKGDIVYLGAANEQDLCPIFWFKFLRFLRDPAAEKFFHKVNSTDGLAPTTPNHILKDVLNSLNLPDVKLFSSHSCRIGGATAAARAGIDLRIIMRHGRWKSTAVYMYIRDCMGEKLSIVRNIL